MYRSSRQKISKDIGELSSTFIQLDIINICRLFHPTIKDYTFFSRSCETFTNKRDHIQSHKTHFKKFKRVEIIQHLLLEHSRINIDNKVERKLENSKYT